MACLNNFLAWIRKRPIRRGLFLILFIYALNIARFFAWPSVAGLEAFNPERTSFMNYYAERAEASGKKFSITQKWVPLSAISPHLIKAVVVAEDDTFWEHSGFNFTSLRNALQRNLNKGHIVLGGSTITQQLAKNLYFSPEKSITRKMQEAIVTWRIEQSLSKERILEIYLNVVEWGDGIYGAEAAARHYFKKSALKLSAGEAARLAVMLPNPKGRSPNSQFVQKQANKILQRMSRY